MIGYYFSKRCKACDMVENDDALLREELEETNIPKGMTVYSAIMLKYSLKKYNVVRDKHLPKVRMWSRWSGSRIPAIEVTGNGSTEKYIGVEGMTELAKKCIEWFNSSKSRRPSVEPHGKNIDLSSKLIDKGNIKIGKEVL